jgi:hypothetical protein
MAFKGLVINVVLLLAVVGAAVTDMAAFMLLTTVGIQLVIAIKALPTETTLGMSFETALVDGSGLIITILFVLSQFRVCKESVLMSKDFFVPCTKVTIS